MRQVERSVKKPVAIILSLKKLHKKGGGAGGTSGSGKQRIDSANTGKRTTNVTGTAKARKSRAKLTGKASGTRGGRPKREKRKEPKI